MIESAGLRRCPSPITILIYSAPLKQALEINVCAAYWRADSPHTSKLREYMRDPLRGVRGAPEALRDAVLTLETAAGLGDRDHMTIYGLGSVSFADRGSGQ